MVGSSQAKDRVCTGQSPGVLTSPGGCALPGNRTGAAGSDLHDPVSWGAFTRLCPPFYICPAFPRAARQFKSLPDNSVQKQLSSHSRCSRRAARQITGRDPSEKQCEASCGVSSGANGSAPVALSKEPLLVCAWLSRVACLRQSRGALHARAVLTARI